mgnify:CR=1 FL=1
MASPPVSPKIRAAVLTALNCGDNAGDVARRFGLTRGAIDRIGQGRVTLKTDPRSDETGEILTPEDMRRAATHEHRERLNMSPHGIVERARRAKQAERARKIMAAAGIDPSKRRGAIYVNLPTCKVEQIAAALMRKHRRVRRDRAAEYSSAEERFYATPFERGPDEQH